MFKSFGFIWRWFIARIKSQLSNKQLLWLILAVLVSVLPQLARLPVWFLPMTGLVVGYRVYAQINQVQKGHALVLSLLAIAAVVFLIYSQGFGISREVSVSILLTMTVMKLLETYRKRDAYLVAMLCYFVIMTRFLYSQDLMLVFFLLIAVFTSSHALALLQFERSKRWFDKKQMKSTVALMATGIPFAVVFFLFFPRLGSPIWGSPDIFGEGKSGISDSMSPGSIVELFMDDSPAFRVTFESDNIPSGSDLYWRGPVLSSYDGKTWKREKSGVRPPIKSFNPGDVVSYQIEQEATGQNYMFGLDYVLNGVQGAFLLSDSSMYSPTKINQIKHYDVTSALLDSLSQKLSKKTRESLLSYPKTMNLRTQAMMDSWVKAQGDLPPQAIVNKALRHFNQQGFFYSYTPPPLEGDVIDQFLFESKRGFCEHYASTFVVMMRMAGIPSRVVTGYQGGVDMGDYLLVKQSDAHAWAEVFYETEPGIGAWQRVDPTSVVSPERLSTGAESLIQQQPRHWLDFEWLRETRQNMDTMRYKWNRWVRDFNVSKQSAMFELMGFDHHEGTEIALVMASLILLLSLVVALWLWLRGRPKYSKYQKLYRMYVKVLWPKAEWSQALQRGIQANNRLVLELHKDLAPLLNQFERLYLQARFGVNQQNDAQYEQQLKRLLQKIKARKAL